MGCETIWRKFCGAMVFTLNPMKETNRREDLMNTDIDGLVYFIRIIFRSK